MRAWRVYDVNDMRLEEIPVPAVRPGWALVRVKGFQPSITEIQRFWGTSKRGIEKMRQLIREIGPFPMGHEICGEVVEAPADSGFRAGDRVAYFHYSTGHIAGSHYPGCFAEAVLLPVQAIAKVDSTIPDLEIPALQPLSSCVQLVREAKIQLGETAAIFGQGVMGLNITQLCRLAGAGRVIGIDVREQCLKMSRELGADVTINATKEDPVQAILDLTEGRGADVVFECASGSPEVGLSGGKTLFQAIDSVRLSGRLVQIAFYHDDVTLDLNSLRGKRIKYIFPDEASLDVMAVGSRLVADGKVRFQPYLTHVLQGLEKLPEAFEITAHKAKHGAINPAVVMLDT
ncbi:MAG: zinc-binding dehydrogenase [Candidatus Tectomicrobia bacterium]|uniref:Zinc-binding dehydrogenase n=1 Tax=Tectimicrobiota bacterium TaxID=2528274 RepID=A0A932GR10_UNCTE|nr:zinc-binding dehydrogenase [Candidatus Tectomicrobia bacterium]